VGGDGGGTTGGQQRCTGRAWNSDFAKKDTSGKGGGKNPDHRSNGFKKTIEGVTKATMGGPLRNFSNDKGTGTPRKPWGKGFCDGTEQINLKQTAKKEKGKLCKIRHECSLRWG